MKKIKYFIPLLGIVVLASCGTSEAKTTTETKTITETETTTEKITTTETTTEIVTTTETITTTAEENLYYRVLSDSVNTYYKDVDISKTGEDFIASLTKVISANYVRASYSGAWDILMEADEDPYDSTKVVCIYTGKSIPKSGKGSLWNREHTWAKSHGFNEEGLEAYTDCHHLTAAHNSTNSTRGDLDFDEVSNYNLDFEKDVYGNKWIANTCFEPRDEVKGDIARAIFYMEARYNSKDTLDLTISDTVPTSTTEADKKAGSLGKLSTLLKWHYEDPVSDEEILRNEVVYKYQKNRNPYIDHPEWINLAYDSEFKSKEVNKTKVFELIHAINDLPEEVTLEDEEKVNQAYTLLNALNAQERLYVNNFNVLSKAQYKINYLKAANANQGASKTYEFTTCTLTTNSYEKAKTIEVNGAQFYLSSCYGKDGDIRIGYNSKKSDNAVDLATIGATGNGAYLKANFSTINLTGVKIESTTPPSRVDKVYIIGVNEGTYKVLYSGAASNTIEANFDSYSGEFIIAVAGTNPVLSLTTVYLYTA